MIRKNTGENKLNAKDRLQEFLLGIDTYISCKSLSPTPFKADFALAETMSLEDMEKLTGDECFNLAFQMYQYADHVATEKAQQESVVRWCENSLNTIIASERQDMAGEYLKHEIKVATILSNHDLAKKSNEWKIVAESRLGKIQSREYNIRRKADILMDKGRRK